MTGSSDRLLSAVARRRRWASFGVWFVRLSIIAAVIYAVWLVIARLGIVPDWMHPATVAIVPAVGAMAAMIVHRRCDRVDAARVTDQRLASGDLFLTHTFAERREAIGAYGPLVAQAAEATAAQTASSSIVPLNGWREAVRLAIVLGALLVATWSVPAIDPFGAAADRRQVADRRQAIEEQKEAAAKRIEQLRQQPLDKQNSKKIEQALAELKQTFNQMKPDKPRENLDELNEQQKRLGAEWRKQSEDDLRRNAGESGGQRFGGADQQKMAEWNREMRAGDAGAMKQQMAEVQNLAGQMAQAKTATERQELAKQMRQKLDELGDFSDRHASSTGLEQAIERAMNAAQAASDGELGDEAREAMEQALEQAGLEADQLAQQMRDLDALTDALRSIQMAKALNQGEGGLDGQQAQNMSGVDEYRQWLEQQMREGNLVEGELAEGQPCPHCGGTGHGEGGKSGAPCPHCKGAGRLAGGAGSGGAGGGTTAGSGRGGALGGPGRGAGGVAPEDPTQQVGFRTEQSKSALQAGRLLMSMKTKELAPAGEAKVDYAEAIERVRQGAGEAIVSERVPPGYHEDIRQYFDTLPAGGPEHE